MNRLVILSSIRQLDYYLTYDYRISDLILPLAPDVRSNISNLSNTIVLVSSLSSHYEYCESKSDSYSKIDSLIHELNNLPFKNTLSITPEIGSYCEFQLRIIVGSIHYNQFIFDCIVKQYPEHMFLVYHEQCPPIFTLRPNPISLFSGVFINSISTSSFSFKFKTLGFSIPLLYPLLSKYFNFFKYAIKSLLYNIPNRFLRFLSPTNYRKRASILSIGWSPEWLQFFRSNSSFFSVDYFLNQSILSRPRQAYFQQIKSIIYKYASVESSLNSSSLTIELLSPLVHAISSIYGFADLNTNYLLTKLSAYDFCVFSVHTFPIELYYCHIFSSLGKPVVCWQHGSQGFFQSPYTNATELRYTSVYLAYSDYLAASYSSLKSPPFKSLAVGSLYNSNVIDCEGNHGLYVSSKWFYTSFPFDDFRHPDDRLYTIQTAFLNFYDHLNQDTPLIFRPSNTSFFNYIPTVPNSIIVDQCNNLRDLISNSTFIVFDTIGTGLLQALQTHKPIFVILGRNDFYPNVISLLSKRVVVCDSISELCQHVHDYLFNGYYPSDLHNDEFVNCFSSLEFSNDALMDVLSSFGTK